MMNERSRIKKNKLRTFRKFKLTHDYESQSSNHKAKIKQPFKQLKLGDTLNPINHQSKESVHYVKLKKKRRSIF